MFILYYSILPYRPNSAFLKPQNKYIPNKLISSFLNYLKEFILIFDECKIRFLLAILTLCAVVFTIRLYQPVVLQLELYCMLVMSFVA